MRITTKVLNEQLEATNKAYEKISGQSNAFALIGQTASFISKRNAVGTQQITGYMDTKREVLTALYAMEISFVMVAEMLQGKGE